MKIRCEVLEVKNDGSNLTMVVQGRIKNAPEWRSHQSMTLQVPDTEPARKTYYLGRIVNVTITPAGK